MTIEDRMDLIQVCFENICKNYNITADLIISEPLRSRAWRDLFTVFIDIHTANSINFGNKEIEYILKTGIKSKKDYRRLRSAVRLKLIDAIRSLRDLTEESLRNLGAKV